jgi:dolichol-phosphate mannosyltransferase
MDAARGESTVLMDGDLQDLPEEIERLYEKFREGYDVVYGIRAEKKHSWFKRVTSRLFLAVMNRIVSGSHSINTNIFRMMRRNVVDAVRQCRERSRFVVGLVSWVGFRQTGVEVRHGERAAGTTKYSLRKMVRLALDAVTSFSSVPLQVATHLGVVVSVGSLLIVAALLVRGLVAGAWVPAAIFVGVGILFVCGVELVCLGVIGEYLGRTYAETRQRPLYVIDRLLEQSDGAGHEAR